ncbi:CRISPR-associated helicase Cas3' [bacterium]|nr:CRISPR-associated helicase Cas3' [bacterium]
MEKKKTLFLLNDLKSHPDKSLFTHLKNVGDLSKKIVKSKKLNLDEFINSETLQEISYLIGITHDFGKSTKYFQQYITEKDEVERVKLKNRPETHHAFLSSIFTYYTVKDYLSRKDLDEKEYYKYLPILSFLVVKRHHGNLDNAKDETYAFDDNEYKIFEKQINNIEFEKLSEIYLKLYSKYEIDVNNFRCEEVAKEINTKQKKAVRKLESEETLFYYFTTLLLYSVLLDADKTDAANLMPVKRRNIPSGIVDRYKKKKFGKPENKINEIRENIYNEIISRVAKSDLDRDKILSLNVPTGTGKTLTSLSFALKLRERLEKEKNFSPRIIYSLPFLSIIDQNYDVFNDVLGNPTTDILLKHHYLSDVSYKTEDEFENIELEKNISKSLLLIEGWNSEIIVTTFIQFFYSIITNRNRAIRKFHNIANSIVILDEVQAIPHKYWLLVKDTIKYFAEHFNTYFVFVTATQPLIFDEEKNEIKPLIKNKKEYFKKFSRVDLFPKLRSMSIEEFKVELRDGVSEYPNKDFLIVMNTINSSKNIYNFVKDELNEMENSKLYYLSTNIVPKERLKRINEIKKKTKERKIIVSTQLIEAGVDIDVDIVYRDFAPLDSINQVAGRCNRNYEHTKGIVRIFVLKEQRNGTTYYPHSIYDGFLTVKTQKVFEEMKSDVCKIDESEFLELNMSYFGKVKEGMSDDESNDILRNEKKLEFAKLSEFELIENAPYKVEIFVEIDAEAEEVMEKYLKIIGNNKLKPFEKKNEFLKIKKTFYEHVISVSKNKIEGSGLPTINQVFSINNAFDAYYVSKENLENYYCNTGFMVDNGNFC